jgi:hypothetical protein
MGSIILRLLTLVEIVLFIKHFKEQHKNADDIQQRWYTNRVHPEDGPAGSDVLDDVPIEKRGYTINHED